jgi:hypothetical protein
VARVERQIVPATRGVAICDQPLVQRQPARRAPMLGEAQTESRGACAGMANDLAPQTPACCLAGGDASLATAVGTDAVKPVNSSQRNIPA